MPITAATMEVTLSEKERCFIKKPWRKRVMPMGMMAMPAAMTMRLMDRTISDCSPFFIFLAFSISWEI